MLFPSLSIPHRRLSRIFAILVWLVVTSLASRAQEQEPADSQRGASLPEPLGGVSSLPLQVSSQGANVVTGSIAVSSLYDDHAATTGNGASGNYQHSFLSTIGLQSSQLHTKWHVTYAGGLTLGRQSTSNAQETRDLTFDMQHNFTRRLMLALREDYLVTSDPFVRIGDSQGVPMLAGPAQLNTLSASPTATRVATAFSGSVSFRLSEYSTIGLISNIAGQHFQTVGATAPGGLGLIDARATTESAFYAVQISRNQSIGAEYQWQDSRFAGGRARTANHTVLLFDDIRLKHNMTLSLFAGPQRSHTHDVAGLAPDLSAFVAPAIKDHWLLAAGATYAWQGELTGFRLSGQRSVSDGSGAMGAIRLNGVSMELQRRVANRWNLAVGGSYARSQPLDGFTEGASGALTAEQGNISLERHITSDFSARVRYARVQQTNVAANVLAPALGNHNRLEFGLIYQFARPFSR